MKIKLNHSVKCKDHDGYKAQTVNELMWGITAHQGDFIECQTPDGPSDDNEYHIILTNWFTNEQYRLTHPVRGHIRYEEVEDEDYSETIAWYENSRTRAENLIEMMKAKNEIDLDFWTKI